jgi:DNA-binding PadR family transcriptional regulator
MTTRALQEATLLVLTALSRGSQHGYGIITDVQEISGGRVKLRPGTLYAALDRLRAQGLIGVDREEIVANRPRRYYRLAPPLTAEPATRRHLAPRPDLRIGDADREATAAALREHFVQGRLTFEELVTRLDAALTATMRSEVAQTTWDLPPL